MNQKPGPSKPKTSGGGKPLKKTGKQLVRNPRVPTHPPAVKKTAKLKKVHFVEKIEEYPPMPASKDLGSPEFCTLLQLAEEVNKIRKEQGSSHSLPEVPRYRNLNFQPQEKLFQDLVTLDVQDEQLVNESKSQTSRTSCKKDPEPDVHKYLKFNLDPEYFFAYQIPPVVPNQEPEFDGKSIYKKLKQWEKEVDFL